MGRGEALGPNVAFLLARPLAWGMSKHEAFLAGERPDDVAFFLHEDTVENIGALDDYAESVEDGIILVLPGDQGRDAFQKAAGLDPMALSQRAAKTDGTIDPDLTGGICPAAEDEPEENHTAKVVFSFVQEQTPEADGIYTEGDVIHGYAVCTCGEAYSQKWLVGER